MHNTQSGELAWSARALRACRGHAITDPHQILSRFSALKWDAHLDDKVVHTDLGLLSA